MKITIEHLGRKYISDLNKGVDLSSSYGKKERELKAWGVPPVKIEPVHGDGWIGSVKAGSSVNFYDISFNPHGNGTHTESLGHISANWESINEQLKDFHFVSFYVNLPPQKMGDDQVVLLSQLKEKVKKWNFEALIIQAGDYALNQDFTNTNPAYFEPALIAFVKEMGVKHLLTNLPSVDKEVDGGALASHKAFWDFPENPRYDATISEMLQFPKELKEGLYLLNLQVAPFHNDAAPSRPIIYPLSEI